VHGGAKLTPLASRQGRGINFERALTISTSALRANQYLAKNASIQRSRACNKAADEPNYSSAHTQSKTRRSDRYGWAAINARCNYNYTLLVVVAPRAPTNKPTDCPASADEPTVAERERESRAPLLNAN
jgi:hypothetical protein